MRTSSVPSLGPKLLWDQSSPKSLRTGEAGSTPYLERALRKSNPDNRLSPDPTPGPCASGDSHLLSSGLGSSVGWGRGRGDGVGATKGHAVWPPGRWLLKADLLWLSQRKRMLISSWMGSVALPPMSKRGRAGDWTRSWPWNCHCPPPPPGPSHFLGLQ